MTDVPVIRTERLVMRAFEQRDFERYAAMMADPEVTRYLADGRPLGRADAWRQMAMFAGHWALRGFGVWAVADGATGEFIGRIGCFEPEGWPAFEVAYTLARPAGGRGYAREGAAAALRYARETLGRTDVVSVIRPGNAGSIRVATSRGATLDGSVDFYGSPALIYRYPPP